MGWSGVLIEPIPSAFEVLRTNRPRCKSYNLAVSKTEGLLEIYNHGAVSSVKDNTTEEFFEGWHKNNNIEIIKVPSKRLDTIIHDSGIKRIDFITGVGDARSCISSHRLKQQSFRIHRGQLLHNQGAIGTARYYKNIIRWNYSSKAIIRLL
jgi:hypothetical protein